MSVSEITKRQVRQRANFACEYCGVSEENAGGELTVDHFRPRSKDGGDDIDNLIYCCVRCNLYKGDFWVEPPNTPQLWNPQRESFENHFWQAEDGRLFALTETGKLSLRILNLNRLQLVTYRQQQFFQIEESRLFRETAIAIQILLQINEEQREIIKAQQTLLEEQRRLFEMLLRSDRK